MKATELLEQQHPKVENIFSELKAGKSKASALLKELANDLGATWPIEPEHLLSRYARSTPTNRRELRRARAGGDRAERLLGPRPTIHRSTPN